MALGHGRVSTNNFSMVKFIVDSNGIQSGATHTTIQGAIDDASAGDMIAIRYGATGTYTEDPVLIDGIALVALTERSSTKPEIIGKVSLSSGESTLKGLKFTTNSDYAISVTGTGNINVYNSSLHGTDNDIIEMDSSVGIRINSSTINLTADVKAFDATGTGFVFFKLCSGSNTASTTASTMGAGGVLRVEHCDFPLHFSLSSTAQTIMSNSKLDGSSRNITILTTAGTGVHDITNCRLISGTASTLSIGSGTTCTISNSTISSSNTNVITGAGTIKPSNISFSGTSSLINTTTQTELNEVHGPISFDGGNNFLDFYEEGSWTPVIDGTSSSPTVSYTTQLGKYTRIGNVVHCKMFIAINTFSGGTGNAKITGLPFTSVNDSIGTRSGYVTQGMAWQSGYTGPILSIGGNGTTITLVEQGDNVNATATPIGSIASGDDFWGVFTYWV